MLRETVLALCLLTPSITACDKGRGSQRSAPAATTRGQAAHALDRYFAAFRTRDFASVPLAPEVMFTGPLRPVAIRGDSAVRAFLVGVAQGAKAVRPGWRVIEGERACAQFEYETTTGVIVPVVECFRFAAGQIVELRPYFDTRPLLAPADTSRGR